MYLFTFELFTKRPDGCYGGIVPYYPILDDLTVDVPCYIKMSHVRAVDGNKSSRKTMDIKPK